MTREDLEAAIIQHNEKQTSRLLRWIIAMVAGGALSILTGGVAWGTLKQTVTRTHQEVIEMKPKLTDLERWKERVDATRVTPQETAALDKRLQRLEDQQTAIIEQLKRIDAKL